MNEQMQVWAHEYAMNKIRASSSHVCIDNLVIYAWKYAEAMQAEADKRRADEPDLGRKPDYHGSITD